MYYALGICSFQCLTDEMTRLYMSKEPYQLESYMGTHCLNATNVPCSIPQIKNVTVKGVQDSLQNCPTFWDYNCELIVLSHAMPMAGSKCMKPCQTSQYKLTLDNEWRLSNETLDVKEANTIINLELSTNFIMMYTEVQVVMVKILNTLSCEMFDLRYFS